MTDFDVNKLTPYSAEPFEFGPIQTKWLEALESGNYRQGRGMLRGPSVFDGPARYCCLGVLCEIFGLPLVEYNTQGGIGPYFEYKGEVVNGFLPNGFHEEVGLWDSGGAFLEPLPCMAGVRPFSLASLNDQLELTFPQIAAYIRHDPHNVFTRAA